jgi:hypothetical protein
MRWLPPKGGGGMNDRERLDVSGGFGHGLRHVGAGMKVQFHQRAALNGARLDVMDAAKFFPPHSTPIEKRCV